MIKMKRNFPFVFTAALLASVVSLSPVLVEAGAGPAQALGSAAAHTVDAPSLSRAQTQAVIASSLSLAQAPTVIAPPPATGESSEIASQPLTLEQAHAIALKNHPGIAAADYRARAADEVFRQARSGLLPQVNLYGSVVQAESANTRIMAGGLNNPSVYSRSAFGAGVSQLITDFGRTSNLAASFKLQAGAEGQNAAATREQVLLDVDRNYFAVLQAQAVENVARQTVTTRQLLLDRVSILAANKLKSDLDVSFARVALEDGKLLLQRAQNDFDSALASLSAVLGYRQQQHFNVVEATPEPIGDTRDVAPLIEQALRDRPELASVRDERDAALRLARSQRDARFPTISAVLAAGDAPSHDVRLPNDYSAGGIQVSVPLFAGGLYQARQREAELRAKAAAESLRRAEDDVTRDVRIAWLNLNNSRERLRTTEQLSRYAANAYELAEARYKAGSSSIVELSQAQLQLTSAQIAETGARYDVLIEESALKYETGGMLAAAARAGKPDLSPFQGVSPTGVGP
ncbi:MAG: Outer rane efflux protein [Gammaproteobacteria bacterium]|nr:Outer rane efflux protein [Gammaproteobacteria bacterium]